MRIRSWLEERKAKISSSRASNQTTAASSNETQTAQQLQGGRPPVGPPNSFEGSNKAPTKLGNARIKDTPIQELWDVAYDNLREEDGALVAGYEAKLTGSVAAGLGQALNLKANRREWMQTVLQSKMDEVNKNASNLLGKYGASAGDVMQHVVNIVNSANGYINSAASANPYTSIAWAGVTFALPLFMNITAEKTSLAKGLDYIASLIAQSHMREELYAECYESGGNHRARFQQSHIQYKTALERLYRQILKFQATTCCYYSKNSALRHGLDAVKWNDWAPLVDEVREKEREFAAVEEMWRDIQRHEERLATETLHRTAITSFSAMNTSISALSDKEHAEILHWLCDIDPSSMYNAARDRHEAGTCEWLIKDSKEFKSWETSDGSVLWLHGKAGSGKSILTSSVIKHLQHRCGSAPSSVIAYFYFSFSDPKKQEVDGMLASLAKQICSHQPHTSQLIQRLRGYKMKGERPDTETLEAMLIECASKFTDFYLVIDALDECPLFNGQRGKLLKSLRRILTVTPKTLHVLLTSRKEPDIDDKLRSILCSPARVEVDLSACQQKLDKDINLYIQSQLSTDEYKSWPENMKKEACDSILKKADCMFQYVRFQLEALRNLSSVAQIRKALQELPVGLDETYNRILETIDPKFQEQVIHTLKWLAFSKEIISIEQLAEIFIIDQRNGATFDETERLFSSTDALKYFSGLIVTQKEAKSWKAKVGTEVRLVHFSLKEYLTSSRIVGSPISVFSFTEINAQLSIVQSCLSYLNRFSAWFASEDLIIERGSYELSAYPLAKYVAHFCLAHLEEIPRELWPAKLIQDVTSALAPYSQIILTLHKLTRNIHFKEDLALLRPYCYTAKSGFRQLTEMLVHQESVANKYITREELSEALHYAAYSGTTDVIQVFLKAGADVNFQGGKWVSALQAAAVNGHLDALKLLVSHGANINSPLDKARSLLACIQGRHTECLIFLLDNGADINMQDETSGTALHAATMYAFDENFHLLLERGADVNALSEKYGTPLQAVFEQRGYESTTMIQYMRKLLQKGADPNIQGSKYGTALQAACANLGSLTKYCIATEIIQLLIENGADVKIQGGEYGTALHAAATSRIPEAIDIMQLLLNNGAEINQQSCTGRGTALHAACYNGEEKTVHWLLEHGADVNAECLRFGSPLQAAMTMPEFRSWKGSMSKEKLRIAKLLIKEGAQVNLTGGDCGSALQAACCDRDVDVETIRFLLEVGADVNAKGGEHGTPLAAAAFNRHTEIIYLLLQNDADANVAASQHGTALIAACAEDIKCVRQLIEPVAFLNLDGKFEAKLLADRIDETTEWVRLLLESEADVHRQDHAAWHAAARNRSMMDGDEVDKLKLLLDHNDIDINHVDEDYGTALNSVMEAWGVVFTETWRTGPPTQKWLDRICLLLNHGADVNVKGGKYGFPLQTACAPAPEVVYSIPRDINAISFRTKFLLKQCPDVNVNAQGGLFGSALQAAAYSGQRESVRLLLDRHADVDARGGKYGSALNAAIIGGSWNIVEMLLQAGATPDCRLQKQPDEEWLKFVEEEDDVFAVARYRKFWEVESGSVVGLGKEVEDT